MTAFLRGLLLCLCLVFASVSPHAGLAQPAPNAAESIDYVEWETVASRAETLVGAGRASTAFLQNLRTQLAAWRTAFLTAQSANNARIETVTAQIQGLGPAPAEGETEPEALAERRAQLRDALAEAQLPRVQATEAFNRADGLIAEIDAILNARQAEALLELGPTPLNPSNWGATVTGAVDLLDVILSETRDNFTDPEKQATARAAAGSVALSLLAGVLLLVLGRRWVARAADALVSSEPRRGRVALSYAVSLGQFVLPVVGIALIRTALSLTTMETEEVAALLDAALSLVVAAFFGLWLGGRLYPAREDRPAAFNTPVELRKRARRAVAWIGLFFGLVTVMQTIVAFDVVPPAAHGVLLLPIYLGLSLGYWRLARFILLRREMGVEDTDGPSFSLRMSYLLSRALQFVAVVGPLMAAVGYLNAADEVVVPTALTLAVFGFFLSLQPVIRDLHSVIFRSTYQEAEDALTPVLVNFALVFGALPLVALAWGVRPERLGEIYAQFLEGFTLGDTRITPLTILAVLLVFAGGYMATRLLQSALRSTVLPRTRMDAGARNAVTSGVGYVGIGLAAIIAITAGGIDLTALGFVVGALSVGIGFGLQNVVSNFVSGIILLIERPISEGDWIEVNGNMGIVKDISVRSTRIETFDKTDVIVPNADFISGTVTNWTRGNNIGRAVVTVGVAYGNDTRRVQDILMEIVSDHPDVSKVPEPGVDFLGFGADSLDFRIRGILRDVNKVVGVKTELHHRIAERFAEEGIEIPFAQRDIWLRNPEALVPAPQAAPSAANPEKEEPSP